MMMVGIILKKFSYRSALRAARMILSQKVLNILFYRIALKKRVIWIILNGMERLRPRQRSIIL
ncbi:MAG: hypothetical protein QF682_10555 [Candidatus Thermoplasmatota archaeon]|nr:hypothetical protein [Candidatus Thermoplasmatota archaeon]